MGYVEQLSQRLAPPYEADGSRELRRKVSMEGTAHVGHRQLPRVVLEESPFELRALEVCLDLVRPCRGTASCCGAHACWCSTEANTERHNNVRRLVSAVATFHCPDVWKSGRTRVHLLPQTRWNQALSTAANIVNPLNYMSVAGSLKPAALPLLSQTPQPGSQDGIFGQEAETEQGCAGVRAPVAAGVGPGGCGAPSAGRADAEGHDGHPRARPPHQDAPRAPEDAGRDGALATRLLLLYARCPLTRLECPTPVLPPASWDWPVLSFKLVCA